MRSANLKKRAIASSTERADIESGREHAWSGSDTQQSVAKGGSPPPGGVTDAYKEKSQGKG